MILDSNANIICLQECTHKFFKTIFENDDILKKFNHIGFQTMTTFYGVAILSEWPAANIFEYDFQYNEMNMQAPKPKTSKSQNSSPTR